MVNRYVVKGDKVVLNIDNGYEKVVPNVDNIGTRLVAQNEVEYIAFSLGKDELYLEELDRFEQARKMTFKASMLWGNATLVVLPVSLMALACGDISLYFNELAVYCPIGFAVASGVSLFLYGHSYQKDINGYKEMIKYEKSALVCKEEELKIIESDSTYRDSLNNNDGEVHDVIIDCKEFDDLRRIYYEFGLNKKKFQKLYRKGILEDKLMEAGYSCGAIQEFINRSGIELQELQKNFSLRKSYVK